jgi:hypothetical protein
VELERQFHLTGDDAGSGDGADADSPKKAGWPQNDQTMV